MFIDDTDGGLITATTVPFIIQFVAIPDLQYNFNVEKVFGKKKK